VLRDDPIADITGYGYYLVNKLAREHNVPVLLMGQGGDELFWGYTWLRQALAESKYKVKHGKVRSPSLRELLLPRGTNRSSLVQYALQWGAVLHGWRPLRLKPDSDKSRLVFYDLNDMWQMGEWSRSHLYTDSFRERLNGFDAGWPQTGYDGSQSLETALTALVCKGYLLENGINQGDRLSMANSVECRLPLVDYKLIETVIGLRKARPGDDALGTKAWLRMAVEDIVPPEVFNRPKRGFNPPVTLWTQALRDRYGDDLRNGYLVSTGVISPEAAEELTDSASRLTAWNDLFFKALVLEMWARSMAMIAGGTVLPARQLAAASA
jgi:asparagine synthase (glutamine-hydrolysing)